MYTTSKEMVQAFERKEDDAYGKYTNLIRQQIIDRGVEINLYLAELAYREVNDNPYLN